MPNKPVILILEDDHRTMKSLIQFYEKHSFTVLSCDNGHSAVQIANTHSIDLALLDLMVPFGDISEILDSITKTSPNAATYIMSAQNLSEYFNVDGWLLKPVEFAELPLVGLKLITFGDDS